MLHQFMGLVFTLLFAAMTAVGAKAEQTAGQWIIVPAPQFESAVEPLIKHRAGQGWQTVRVQASDYEDGEGLRERIETLAENYEGRTVVCLVGMWRGTATSSVPSNRGRFGRMQGRPSDWAYGRPEDDGGVRIAVGRLPVRTPEEGEAVIRKILSYEGATPAQDQIRIIIGHPGGRSEFERRTGENIVRTAVNLRRQQIHEMWTTHVLMDFDGTPESAKATEFGPRAKGMLTEGQTFAVYSGHSSPGSLFSRNGNVLPREEWGRLKIDGAAGVLISCGCYSCQTNASGSEGYGLYALRNPHGPAAVIGAFGESYAAFGQLAFDGVLACMKTSSPPPILGDYWLAIQHGIARGAISPAEFFIFDMADGSGGRVPLDDQRPEHAEMWTLLGDPAMKIPYAESHE